MSRWRHTGLGVITWASGSREQVISGPTALFSLMPSSQISTSLFSAGLDPYNGPLLRYVQPIIPPGSSGCLCNQWFPPQSCPSNGRRGRCAGDGYREPRCRCHAPRFIPPPPPFYPPPPPSPLPPPPSPPPPSPPSDNKPKTTVPIPPPSDEKPRYTVEPGTDTSAPPPSPPPSNPSLTPPSLSGWVRGRVRR